MLKVNKSGCAFALVLLLSTPARAMEKSNTNNITSVVAKSATETGIKTVLNKCLAATSTILPSWQTIKTVSGNKLSSFGTGFSKFFHGAATYATPATKATLAFASRHSTICKIIGATVAAAGMGFSFWKLYTKTRNKNQPTLAAEPAINPATQTPASTPTLQTPPAVVAVETTTTRDVLRAPAVVENAANSTPAPRAEQPTATAQAAAAPTSEEQNTPVVLSPEIVQLQKAKNAAASDVQHLQTARQAEEESFALDNNPNADEEVADLAAGRYATSTNFTSSFAASAMPAQMTDIRERFSRIFRQARTLVTTKKYCNSRAEEYHESIRQLNGIIEELDGQIEQETAIALSSQQ